MKSVYIVLILVLLSNYVYAENRTVVTTTPIYNYPPSYYQNYFSDMNALEKYAFDKCYPRENSLTRLQRLELNTFGAIQNGDLASRYENVKDAILSRPKQNYRTSVLRNLGNYFSGQMTGFTPTINTPNYYPYTTSSNPNKYNSFNYLPYPSSFGNTSITEYSRGPFGGGYHVNNYGVGSSSGVKILD